jgi:hypothetical protein
MPWRLFLSKQTIDYRPWSADFAPANSKKNRSTSERFQLFTAFIMTDAIR